MATARSILKSYFLTGKKPTQGQFAALIDSFLHLSEDSLSISQITNLAAVLAGKASTAQIDALSVILNTKQDKPNQLLTGCVYGTGATTAYITSGSWLLNGIVINHPADTTFVRPSLCSTGLFKTVAFYGQADGTLVMETSAQRTFTTAPQNDVENAALLRWLIVSDSTSTTQGVNNLNLTKTKSTYFITILPTDTLIIINWDTQKKLKHGNEPFDIQLYEVASDGSMQKSTALLTVNPAKTVYSFYVGENSNLNFYYKII